MEIAIFVLELFKIFIHVNKSISMIRKLPEVDIDKENPFKNCKLDRQIYAEILTHVVSNNSGFVLAIDGHWGSGKTTFMKMWKQSLENRDFRVLYFNVWEYDFNTDPMIGMVSQLRSMSKEYDKKGKIKKFVLASGRIAKNTIPVALKLGAKQITGEWGADVIEAIIKTGADSFGKRLDAYEKQCQSIKDFRTALEDLVTSISEEKPLIFIIDELDRCNPHFAVKVLERVKHLFNVQNIVFVLSIDKAQLCHSICGYYGSEKLNAEEYLKRFIDIEYKLPEPKVNTFVPYLYDMYEFSNFFAHRDTIQRNPEQEKDEFSRTAEILFEYMHFNLRQMEKIFAHIRLAFQTYGNKQAITPGLMLLLTCFRVTDSNFYDKIVNRRFEAQGLLDYVEEKFPIDFLSKNKMLAEYILRYIVWEIAELIVSYNLNERAERYEELIQENSSKLLIKPKHLSIDLLKEAITYYDSSSRIVLPLSNIIQHLEFLTPFYLAAE